MSEPTPQQIAEYREAFALFDRDGTNQISYKDLGVVVRSLGATPTEAELSEIATQAGAETLGFDEFLEHITRLMPLRYTKQEVVDAFQIFDKEGTGEVSINELRHVITSLGEKLTNDEVDEMLKEASVTSDGTLRYKEFVEAMLGN